MAENYRFKFLPLDIKLKQASDELEYTKPISTTSCYGKEFDNPYLTWRKYNKRELPIWKLGWIPQNEREYNEKINAGMEKYKDKIDCAVKSVEEYRTLNFDVKQLKICPVKGELKATWFGHSSVFLQFPNGLNCLVDPVFSKRCSPIKFLGPVRNTKVPMEISSMKQHGIEIHLVLISHNHYDHLDKTTIPEIQRNYPNARFIIPKKTSADIVSNNCNELTWWESIELNVSQCQAKITAVPAQHWSQRTMLDKNKSLWAGYVIECQGVSCYFAGDTGYCQAFKDIGQKFPEITLALIPIGAYLPRWFMGPQHVSPEEAVQVFRDLGCKNALGIHWLTFDLADDRGVQPVRELEYFKLKNQVDSDRFIVTSIGTTKEYR